MMELARRYGRQVRPHVKAHKSTTIGRRQLEAGAVGLCCATVREAEVMAQVGLAGSTWVGRGVYMAGQAGAKGHVHIGAHSIIGGATGVTSDVEPGSQILGVPPGVDRKLWGRIVAAWKRLPALLPRVRELEKRIEELERAQAERAASGASEVRRGK